MKKAKFKLASKIRYVKNPIAFSNNKLDGTIVAIETSIIESIDEIKEVNYTYQVYNGFNSYNWIAEPHIFKQ